MVLFICKRIGIKSWGPITIPPFFLPHMGPQLFIPILLQINKTINMLTLFPTEPPPSPPPSQRRAVAPFALGRKKTLSLVFCFLVRGCGEQRLLLYCYILH